MKIKSPEFGSAEIADDLIIEFPEGLPGFEACRRFALVHEEGREPDVFLLQCADDPEVGFSVTPPARLGVNLEFVLTAAATELLQLQNQEDLADAVIVRAQEGADANPASAGLSANFMAPLVINTRARRGLQKVIGRMGCDITLRQQD
jgi:flagellar assembly factor FliW